MGRRTMSVGLVLRALFLDSDAYNQMRDDDNPFIEGLFLLVIIGVITALLSLVGQVVAWAGMPSLNAIKDIILTEYQKAPWWTFIQGNTEALTQFQRTWDILWQVIPNAAGAPSPATAAANVVAWPVGLVLSWLVYGLLAHLFARLLHGRGTLGQTMGLTALSFTPMLFRGLGFIPYFVIGGVLSTWQLILRYKGLRTAHQLPWNRAFWATVLPFVVYLLFWLLFGGLAAALIAAVGGR